MKKIKWRTWLGLILTMVPVVFIIALQAFANGWLDAVVFIVVLIVWAGLWLVGDWLRKLDEPRYRTKDIYLILDSSGDFIDASTNEKHVIESLKQANRIGYVINATRVRLNKKGDGNESKQSN